MTVRVGILRFLAIVTLVAAAALASFVRSEEEAARRNLGIVGFSAVVLPRGDYQVRPLDDRSELLLHVESVTPAESGGFLYQIQYMGLEAGEYSLVDFLTLPDGRRAEEIKDFVLKVRAELPEDHNGRLEAMSAAPFPFIGGYRVFLGVLGFLWVSGIVLFIRSYRKKKVAKVVEVVVPEPGFAERIRPLVESAAIGTLSLEDKTVLERLLMGFWRDQLDLTEIRVADAILELKQHAVAGELLRAMERWLHQPGGSGAAEIPALLEPYRNGALERTKTEVSA